MKLGYTLLYVEDVPTTMDFYERAFGLTKGFMHESQQYGEMDTGATKLGFVQHATASANGFTYDKVTAEKKPQGFEIGFVTFDVEEIFMKAVECGATVVSPPKAKPWGQVVSYVRDCNGFLVEICSEMAD